MSTCMTVREALPGIAAGEPDEVGAQRHLEGCAACRAEREALGRDLGRIRGELATLASAADVVAGRGGARGATGGTRGGARVLSWWTVGVGVAALVVGGFLVGQALRQEVPDGSERAGKFPWATFSDVTEIVERGDAARVVQVRIQADGGLRLRWRTLVPEGPWIERGPWSAGGTDPKTQWDGLRELHMAFSEASPQRLPSAEPRARQETRLILDVDPTTRWRLVQWVIAVASAPPHELGRLTFLVDDGPDPIDIDLPADSGTLPEEGLGTIKLFRKVDPADPAQVWTRVRWQADEARDWDLPANPAPPRDVTWASLLNSVAASIKRAAPVDPVAVEVKAPPPTGGDVPTWDVFRVMVMLRQAGVARILLEGAPPPLLQDRGNRWDFQGSEK